MLLTIFVDISLRKIVFEFAKVAYQPAGNVTSPVNRLIKKKKKKKKKHLST